MGLFDKFKKPSKPEPIACTAAPLTVLAPVDGQAIALADAPDPVFAQGMLGQGIVIKPSGSVAYAPYDGTVSAAMGSGHGVGLVSDDGVEVLIHIGVDTVQMKGEGFQLFVKQGTRYGPASRSSPSTAPRSRRRVTPTRSWSSSPTPPTTPR